MKDKEAIRKLREVCRRQHKSLSTEESYAGWLKRYMSALGQMSAEWSSELKLERFLTELACFSRVSASTQNQAFNAIVFFYKDVLGMPLKNVDALRATRPDHIRHAPTVKDTFALLDRVGNVAGYPTNLIARLLYGCGLRVTEPLNLRIKDIRDDRLFIMGGKGRKDRVVSLPDSLVLEVRAQMDFARAIWSKDKDSRIPVEMPDGLARKYPEYRFAWGWAWLFPSHQPCRHPRTQEWVRWRCHEANVQRAIKAARRALGIMVLPHELRHAYATHCLDRGTNIKAIQEAMGHKQVETTIGYCHAEALSVKSPLESQPPSPVCGTMLADVASRPIREPVAYSICEPYESSGVNSLGVIRTEKTDTRLSTPELDKGSHINLEFGSLPPLQFVNAGHAQHHRDREMIREAFELVGPATAKARGGWYWNRLRENRGKFERVLAAVRADRKERPTAIHNWGGHFCDLWRRFADK